MTRISEQFTIVNGVKQGGIMSPVLFTVYIDLLGILKKRNIGCKIGNNFMCVFGYADDLSQLCPMLSELKKC